MKKTIFVFLFIGFLLMIMLPVSINGNENENEVNFSVKAIIPENQINKNKTYFDLKVKREQVQEIDAIIYNHSDLEITIKVTVNNAMTNQNGIITYHPTDEEVDTSLKIPLNEIMTTNEEEVTIPARKSKKVTAKLRMPKEEFDGIILGGLHFEKFVDEKEAELENENEIKIKNRYAYVIGVQLSENDVIVEPQLHLQSITPALVNYRTAIVANIQNSEPVLINGLDVEAEIYNEEAETLLREKVQNNIQMAPNSNMDFVIDWENNQLEQGVYILKMKASLGSKTWEWNESFTIEKEQTKINNAAIGIEKDNSLLYKITIIVLISVLIILLYVIKRLRVK